MSDADDLRRRAEQVDPRYVDGELVRVAGSRNQAEAELIQSLLLEEGIPSMLVRTRGFDVPDMLAAGPRDVMVSASGVAAAREVLLDAEMIDPGTLRLAATGRPSRVLAGLLLAVILVGAITWIGVALAS